MYFINMNVSVWRNNDIHIPSIFAFARSFMQRVVRDLAQSDFITTKKQRGQSDEHLSASAKRTASVQL